MSQSIKERKQPGLLGWFVVKSLRRLTRSPIHIDAWSVPQGGWSRLWVRYQGPNYAGAICSRSIARSRE